MFSMFCYINGWSNVQRVRGGEGIVCVHGERGAWRNLASGLALGAALLSIPPGLADQAVSARESPVEVAQAMKEMDIKLNKSIFEEAWGAVYTMYYDTTAGERWSTDDWIDARSHVFGSGNVVFSSRERTHDAIRDIVSAIGDPYTRFLTPEEYRYELEARSDKVLNNAGIGLQLVDPFDGVDDLQILAPLPESPAERAGIHPGDYLEAIDDIDIAYAHMTPDEAIAVLRGPEGSPVSLTLRTDDNDRKEIILKRRPLSMKAVRSEVVENELGKTGYVRIHLFTSRAREELVDNVRGMVGSGVDAIVIDVRNCLGGVFQEALVIASAFIDCPDCVLVQTLDGNGIERNHIVEKQRCVLPGVIVPSNIPMAVLVNGGSASSSEVLAVALKENGRATLIGERTFGKGLIQHSFVLRDGSAVTMTVAEYVTPRRHQHLQNKGARPDIACKAAPAKSAAEDSCVDRASRALLVPPTNESLVGNKI